MEIKDTQCQNKTEIFSWNVIVALTCSCQNWRPMKMLNRKWNAYGSKQLLKFLGIIWKDFIRNKEMRNHQPETHPHQIQTNIHFPPYKHKLFTKKRNLIKNIFSNNNSLKSFPFAPLAGIPGRRREGQMGELCESIVLEIHPSSFCNYREKRNVLTEQSCYTTPEVWVQDLHLAVWVWKSKIARHDGHVILLCTVGYRNWHVLPMVYEPLSLVGNTGCLAPGFFYPNSSQIMKRDFKGNLNAF